MTDKLCASCAVRGVASCNDCVKKRVNHVWPAECVHVRNGDFKAIERLELTLRLVTLEGHDADYRYVKGPDVVTICPLCAGKLLGMAYREGIIS